MARPAAVGLARCCALAATLPCGQQCLQAISIPHPSLSMWACPVHCKFTAICTGNTLHVLGNSYVAVLANGALAGSGSDKRAVCSACKRWL